MNMSSFVEKIFTEVVFQIKAGFPQFLVLRIVNQWQVHLFFPSILDFLFTFPLLLAKPHVCMI